MSDLVNSPCSRCGHTLYQHSTGVCDIAGCPCEGWVNSCARHITIHASGVILDGFLSFLLGLLMGAVLMLWVVS